MWEKSKQKLLSLQELYVSKLNDQGRCMMMNKQSLNHRHEITKRNAEIYHPRSKCTGSILTYTELTQKIVAPYTPFSTWD